jgi:hypothetical protein
VTHIASPDRHTDPGRRHLVFVDQTVALVRGRHDQRR